MQLFKELQRRNVIRVAIGYIVSSWLLLQIADLVLDIIGSPDWVLRTIALILALGFPIVLFFSWAYEVTPEGIKLESEIDRSQSITHVTGGKLDRAIVAVLVIALAYFAYDKFVLSAGREAALFDAATQTVVEQSPAHLEDGVENDKSIAVLPFADMSPNKDQDYFSDGLSEELLNLLAKIPQLKVAARTSSFQFKGQTGDIADIGKQLKVAHLLEGSVRTAGNRVRVTAQLIQAEDGYHLWSETYNRNLDDIFAIQDEIAGAVVAQLKITLLGEAPKARKTDPEAYSLYLQGLYFRERRTQKDWENSSLSYQQALVIEPDFAAAWAGLSMVLGAQAGQGYIDLHEGYVKARSSAQKALELNPNLAEAHAAMGLIQLSYDWDWDNAEASFQRALDLAPGDARVLAQMGILQRYVGELATSVALNERAVSLDPLSLNGYHQLGLALTWDGQLEEAMAVYDHLLNLQPEFAAANMSRSRILLAQGKPVEALAAAEAETEPFWRRFGVLACLYALQRNEEADPQLITFIEQNQDDSAYQIAAIYGARDETDKVFEWLDIAYEQRDGGIPEVLHDPMLTSFSNDPRWAELLRKIGLYEAWVRASIEPDS